MSKDNEANAMTFEQLYQQLGALTPEQRSHKVIWMGEERGGYVEKLHINPEDQVCPDGECWETRAHLLANHDEYEMTKEEAEAEPICSVKFQPYLLVD